MARSVGTLVAESLVAHGADLLFCVPGESFLGLTDAITDLPSLKLVVCRHEGGASYMAVADGRMRGGRAGLCLVSRGPGVANAMIGLHTAFHDAVPMLLLVGQIERRDMGRGALQEQNYSRLLADTTKAVIEVSQAAQASEAIARAYHIAESGTPGPVAVILPEDLLDDPADHVPVTARRPATAPQPSAAQLDDLCARLATAERPLVHVGSLADGTPGQLAAITALAERWMLPVAPTHRWPHLFDSTHSHYAGYVGNRVQAKLMDAMKQADLLIALGERMTDVVSQSYTWPAAPDPQLPFVHIWPDPLEINRVFRADLPIVADPHAVVAALLSRSPAFPPSREAWIARLNGLHRELTAPRHEPAPDGVNFAAVCIALAQRMAPDAMLTTDAGNFTSFVHRYVPFGPRRIFLGSAVGGMGAAVPMAVAAALRHPGRQAIAVVGDGGALMTGNEIATAMRHGAAPVILIADNRTYGSIRMHHGNRYPGRPVAAAADLVNPDFAAWARAFGAEGYVIRAEEEIAPVLDAALAHRRVPAVVHVHASAQQVTAWRRSAT
ncbi:thiamine pyrophosphate-dependent enzyme [Roseomonas sp. AR75]|uniref:thiamine pyrophosphate-dependent enzyme n=1 Tax=Roseomonas sp. AR75 TaxID=2562311 RepID=UPI0010BFCB24|nr:thiamine pyrophosphate-dependent enzyme [Roseomonas sp. AR75]